MPSLGIGICSRLANQLSEVRAGLLGSALGPGGAAPGRPWRAPRAREGSPVPIQDIRADLREVLWSNAFTSSSQAWARALAWAALAGAAGTLLMELPPLLMGQVLECLLREGDELRGWAFVAASSACIACTGLVIACVHRLHSALGVEVRSALACAVYHQVLRLGGGTCARIGSHALSSFCSTLVSVDCERAYILCHYGLFLWIDFLMVTACLLLLVLVLGPAGLGGCAVLVGGTLVQRVFMGWLVSARRDMQAASDRRLAATQELLENIRSIKMMGLEGVLSERICGERGVELARQRRVLLLRALNGSFTYCLVHLSLLAVLVVARQGQQQVTLPGLFAALALLNANRVVFMVIPFELAALSEGLASLGRVQGFLREERSTGGGAGPEDAARPPPTDATAEPEPARLQVADGVFAWASGGAQGRPGRDELRAPGLEVRPGELAVVVGTSGGGKSSLCSALLGWMPRVSGELEGGAAGPVAFCPQEPWVLSGTVRENVLGHAGGDEERLWQALRLAALEEEVRALPGGADCEIGFRGLNLSGGQKARLALARALALQGARAYVLDDALSSLDQATAEALVEGTVLGHLAGRTRVAVLNSHYEALLPHAQVIVLVEQGVATAFRRKEEFEATEFAQLLAAGRTERAEHEGEPEGASPSWIARGLPAGVGAEELAAGPPPGGAAPEARAGEVASRLYEAEVRKRGPLHPSVYRDYFGLGGRGGGAATSAALLVLVMVALALPDLVRVFAELYLAQVLEEQGATVDGTALLRFSLMVALTFLLALARALVFTALARRSSRRVHSRLLEGLCRAPIHTFFDVMPPGRLLNFFGKDLDAVDTLLPYQALEFLQDVAVLGTALLVCVVVFPMVPPVEIPWNRSAPALSCIRAAVRSSDGFGWPKDASDTLGHPWGTLARFWTASSMARRRLRRSLKVLLAILPCAFLLLRVRQLYVCSSRELMRTSWGTDPHLRHRLIALSELHYTVLGQ
ncbi:unnamed protein product [Prorocentrum cordatum]|uniref:ATP-dependent transporter ycf16 n=1 Tax=Prorocentrum cordatum TaxID=2364126 RepID=A0ABN9XGK0_9DINO|nr:unnamed protein product [Polarella glacialis]